MSKKIYNLNGNLVDGNGDVIDAEYQELPNDKESLFSKTGAKVAAVAIASIILCTSFSSKMSQASINTSAAKNNQVFSQTELIPSYKLKLDYLYTDIGEKYAIDDLTIATNLENCAHCQVSGVYFSKTEEELYSVTVVRKYQETIEPNRNIIYVAPQGYVAIGEKCYKLPENFDTTLGYENLENYTEYCTPEGYILIDNRVYQINKELFDSLNINAIEVGLDEELPEGYIKVETHLSNKKLGIKKEDYEKAIDL